MGHLTRRQAMGTTVAAIATSIVGPVAFAGTRHGIMGETAPQLTIRHWIDGDGQPTALDQQSLDGRWVVLKFFQSWCPGCHRHGFPTLKRMQAEYGQHPEVRLLAVQTVFEGFSTNTKQRLREIQLQYDLTIDFGHDAGDPNGQRLPRTMRDYRSGGTPWFVIVDPTRKVVFNDFHIDAARFIAWLSPRLSA